MDQYYKVLVIPLDGSRMIAKDKFGIECISKCVFKSKISEVKNNVFLTYAWSMFPIDSHCKYQKTFIFVQYSRNLLYSTCNLGIVVELHRTVIRYIMKTPVLIQNFIFTLMTSCDVDLISKRQYWLYEPLKNTTHYQTCISRKSLSFRHLHRYL